jgi:Protein of unknown function (DUF4239)
LLVSLFVLISVGGLLLVQRLVPIEVRQRQNDVAGFIYAVLGVAYAVLLALMVIAVWERWEGAKATVDNEASELAEIYWIAHQLPQPEGRHIQELAHSYAEVVVDEEWPLMAQGEFSPKAWATIDDLRDSIQSLDSSTDDQLLLDQQALERVHGLADARRDRLLAAEEGLPAIMWVVMVGGGFIVVGFTYLFGMENNLTHILMVAALALIISSVLFTVASLNYPFSGDVHIGPDAFEQILWRFKTSDLSDL